MKFEFTPEEAQTSARAVAKHLRKRAMNLRVEKVPWSDAPYATTITATKSGLSILVEAQGRLSYHRALRDFVAWIAIRRLHAEVYLATTSDAVIEAGILRELKLDGVGLLLVDDNGDVHEHQKARNAALVVTPDPTLIYGNCKRDVDAAVKKFNEMDRKDGLRDMCEIVERLTEEVGIAACHKGIMKIPVKQFIEKDWAGQINELARPEVYHSGRPLVSTALKDDLHSFRNARNLFDHKVKSHREETKRQKQFAERMMQGPRLVAELVSIKRKIR